MRTTLTLSVGVAFVLFLLLFPSFSTAIPVKKITTSYNKVTPSEQSENGTVKITIRNGIYEHGFLSRIGYTLDFDNTRGTKTVNFSFNITYYYLTHNAYEWGYARPDPMGGIRHSVLSPPFPMYPFKVTIDVKANTSTNLSLSRVGIMLFNCYLWFIKGNESVTGPS
ncbi:MAG: hypothetical protein QXX20_01895 [Candidatus Thermoplasmatota archaeon]